MARRLAKNITSDHLSCPICKETLEEPRLLPCDHTLCTNCLSELISSSRHTNRFSCPVDRKTFRAPTYRISSDDWAKSFPADELATQLLRTIYCEVNLSDAKTLGLCCPDHDDAICEFFCFTCLQILCSECAVEKHRNLNCDCRSINKSSDHVNVRLHEVSEEIQRLERYGKDIFYKESEKEQLLMHSRSTVQLTLMNLRKVVQNYEKIINAKVSSLLSEIDNQTQKHKVNHLADDIVQALSDKQQEIHVAILTDATTDRLLLLTHCQAFLKQYNDRIYKLLGMKQNPVKLQLEIDQTFLDVCKTLEDMPIGTLHVLPADSTDFEDSETKVCRQRIRFATNTLPSRALYFQHSFTIELVTKGQKEIQARITDIVFNGHSVIIVDNANFKAQRFRIAYGNELVDEIRIYGVYGIANIHDNDDVIVTAPTAKSRLIRLSTYQGLRIQSEIVTAYPYYNITPLPNKQYAVLIHDKPKCNANKKVSFDWSFGVTSNVDIIEEDGTVVKSLRENLLCEPEEFGQPFIMPLKSICGLPNSCLVVITETKTNDVIRCIDQRGQVKWTYKLNDKPEGVCCSNDSIYVYLRKTKVVRVFSFEGDLRPTSTVKLDRYDGDGHGLVLSLTNKLIGVVDRTNTTRLFDLL